MPKSYKKVAGVWQPIKKIFIKVAGSWLEAKKVYKNVSGTWKIVHQNAADLTFGSSIGASTSTGILLSSYIDPNSADVFNIIINPGVLLYGKTGTVGADGTNVICLGNYTYCTNGGTGGAGGAAINLSGFSGKTINLYNSGKISGGNGGNGGNGGSGVERTSCGTCSVWGCPGGAGGAAGVPWYGNSGVTINVITNVGGIVNGSTGIAGNAGSNGYDDMNCE